MKSIRMAEKLMPDTDSMFSSDGGECSSMKRRKGFNEVSSCDNLIVAETVSQIENLETLSSKLSQSASESPKQSLDSSNLPVRMNFLSHGFISVIGRSRVMEDAVTVALGREFSVFTVYNNGDDETRVSNGGHGQFQLLRLLAKEIEEQRLVVVPNSLSSDGEIDWKEVISACFEKMDEKASDWEGEFVELSSVSDGSMALVVVVVGKEELVVANCGDSRVVMCRAGVAMPLSLDHKPDESERMEASGGRVMNRRGCRIQGGSATSRAIEDNYLQSLVASEPEVTVTKRTESDEFLIIASDGLWDVLSYIIACEVVRTCLDCQISTEGTSSTKAAAMLARLAIAKGSEDNISVIVVELKK